MSRQSSFLPRRQGQTPNMVGHRKLPPGPGPLNHDGKKISYKINRSNVRSPSGPLKAIHTGYENNNYTPRVSSPVGGYPLSRKSVSTDDLIKKFSAATSFGRSSTSSSPLSNKSTRNSLEKTSKTSLPSPTERKLSSPPIGVQSTYTDTLNRNLYSSSSTVRESTLKSSLNRSSGSSTYSSNNQALRRRTQSFDTTYCDVGSSEVLRPVSRTRRVSESIADNSFSSGSSSLPTDSFVGSGFCQTKKDLRGRIGLTNIGNTCFMNSVLQCLGNCDLLQDYIVKENYLLDINESNSPTKGKLIKAFANVMKNLWAPEISTRTSFSPKKFKDCLDCYFEQFRGARQHDSQEFLRYLLEALHEDTNSVKKRPKYIEIEDILSEEEKAAKAWKIYQGRESSFFSNLFVGQLKSVLECNECKNRSVTFDPFWDLSLPIPRNKCDVSLNDCLNEFTKQEVLEGDDRPTCSKCKAKRKCLKSFSIERFPEILVIHLKRFSGRSKLSNFVDFPVSNLSLASFASTCTTKDIYHLIATSNHSGFTYGGHYIAHAKHTIHKKWLCYDDTRVDEVSDTSIRSSQAYVLFYQKSSSSPAKL